ncbi:MAG TPA: glycosyltransferase 87 family protein [Gemmataceae bacterium]|nr:glycosyltransferase 87 family protein [Gemmataceae bacterium]
MNRLRFRISTMNSVIATLPTASASDPHPPTSRNSWRRLALLVVVVALVWWHALMFICSWALLPANDFGRMYTSAALFMAGEDMYRWTPAAPALLSDDYAIDLYNMNPPHLHLLLLPLTLLHNPDYAFVLWWALSGLCLFHAGKWVLAEIGVQLTPSRRQTALLLLLAFSGTGAMIYTAQLSFVLLVPATLMWREARHGRWSRAGALLGLLLSVKPFLAVLLVYFCWRRRWRAAASCLAGTALAFAAGVAVFGWDNHVSWRHRLAVSDGWAWLPMNASLMGMLSRTFSESVWYVPLACLPAGALWLLWLGIGGALGLVTLAATSGGSSAESVDQDFALLLAASLLFCPLGWMYYLWLVLPPLAALLARGWLLHESPKVGASLSGRWRRWLLAVMLIAALWPTVLTRLGQPEAIGPRRDPTLPAIGAGWPFAPQAIATLIIGNLYFWGLLALWTVLTASGFAWKRKRRGDAGPCLAPLHPDDYRISVVMPVYSETDTVRQIAEWLIRELGPHLHEIILVQSPRSSEASRAVCRLLIDDHPQVQLHMQGDNPGLGRAVREGFALATGNLVLTIDSDGEMEIETVPRMLAEMALGGHALVAASRWLPGGGFSGYSRLKYHLNWCFQQLFRWLFWTPLHDLTYGFKLIRAELVRGLDWQGTLHEIACETTLKPIRLGVSVAEVPSKWTARTQGASKNTFWRNFRYVSTAISLLLHGARFIPRDHPVEREAARRAENPDLRTMVSCGEP